MVLVRSNREEEEDDDGDEEILVLIEKIKFFIGRLTEHKWYLYDQFVIITM